MSEENQVPVETPQEAPQAVETPVEPQTFEVDGKQLTAEEVKNALYEAKTQNESLENYKQHADKLLNDNFTDSSEKLNSVKYLLQQQGYDDQQISHYINTMSQRTEEAPQGVPMQEQAPQQNPYEDVIRQQQEQIEALERQQKQINSSTLKGDLNNAVDNVFANHKDINNLLQRFNTLNNSENTDGRLELMKQEIMTETMNNLKNRKNAGGIFDNSWFAEETNRAADSVAAKFRTVIGDPDRIQRSPETASELHSFINSKPVEPPKYEPGDRVMGKGENKVKDFTNDALSRLAAEISLGGETKA
tara:strand:+ start:1029 stop:1940 length:912 start_codon:yes stop_codon:yes gene_type:complete